MELAGLYEIPIILTGAQTQAPRNNLVENLITLQGIPKNNNQTFDSKMEILKARRPGHQKYFLKPTCNLLK